MGQGTGDYAVDPAGFDAPVEELRVVSPIRHISVSRITSWMSADALDCRSALEQNHRNCSRWHVETVNPSRSSVQVEL